MITNDANALVLNSVIAVTLDKIEILSLRDVNGEYYRMSATSITQINSKKYEYTFYLSESLGNGDIVEVALHGNGATVSFNTGTTYATQALVLTKNNTQSLTITWTVEVR